MPASVTSKNISFNHIYTLVLQVYILNYHYQTISAMRPMVRNITPIVFPKCDNIPNAPLRSEFISVFNLITWMVADDTNILKDITQRIKIASIGII